MTIGRAVKSLRKRLGKNQMQLAEMMGCQRNTISRYELGSFPPGPIVLMRLLQIAKSEGVGETDETATIMRELKAHYAQGHIGGGKDVEETISLMNPVLAEIQRADPIMVTLPEQKRQDFGFRQFVPAVAHVIEACDTVDQSVTDFLHLWAAHSKNESAAQYFREAVGFLRGQLWGKNSR